MSPEQIQFLLRQRGRPEMPQGYTEQLLKQLHDQQRSELLQRPIWRIAADRVSTFLSEHSLSTPKYALALAALVALCLGVIALLKPVAGVLKGSRSLSSHLVSGALQPAGGTPPRYTLAIAPVVDGRIRVIAAADAVAAPAIQGAGGGA